jgi:hypothetical protein
MKLIRTADTLARLLAIDKRDVEASYWLARTYQALGGECYDRFGEEFPESWRAHQLRAEGYSQGSGALRGAPTHFCGKAPSRG